MSEIERAITEIEETRFRENAFKTVSSEHGEVLYSRVKLSKDTLELVEKLLRDELEREKNEPLTLDELKQMDGEPIWIKEFPPYAFAGYKVLSLRVVDVYGDIVCEDGDIYEYERYGETWLAYRSKPKEEV